MPPSHLLSGPQIGHGWMKVLQVLLGHSASVMQPKFAFVPATQAPVSQTPEPVQLPSLQHGVLAGCPPPGAHRPVSLAHVPPGQEPAAAVPQPPLPVQFAPGVDPPEQRIGRRSASRNIVPVIGSAGVMSILPVE